MVTHHYNQAYDELFATAQAAADRLVSFGVSRGDIVGTAVEGLQMVVTHLAILLAGGELPTPTLTRCCDAD